MWLPGSRNKAGTAINTSIMNPAQKAHALKGALTTGVINAILNGGIQYFLLKDKAPIALSVDSITNNTETVLGEAVPLALSLSVMLTIIGYFTLKEKKVPFFPKAFWSVLKHGFFTFGVITSLAVLWQRYMGTVEVPLMTALVVIGLIAGAVSVVISYLTVKACVLPEMPVEERGLV